MFVCRDFAKGHCPRGVLCRFPHSAAPKELPDHKSQTTAWKPDAPAFQPRVNHNPASERKTSTLLPNAREFQAGGQQVELKLENIPLWRPPTTVFHPRTISASQIQAIPIRNRPVCKFYLENKCTKLACKFSHDAQPTAAILPAATNQEHVLLRRAVIYDLPKCKFFMAGKCGKGSACDFKHSVETEAVETVQKEIHSMAALAAKPETTDSSLLQRDFQGVTVKFSDGAEILDVELASDISIVQMSGLPLTCTAESVVDLLAVFGFAISNKEVTVRTFNDETVAQVRVKDATFSDDVVKKFREELRPDGSKDITVSKIQAGGVPSDTNRMQLASVTCSWYKPSQIAYLHYRDRRVVYAVKKILDSQAERVLDGKIKCETQPSRGPVFTVQLSGISTKLTRTATEKILKDLLTGSRNPYEIQWSPDTISLSEDELETKVRNAFDKYGAIKWERAPTPNKSQSKAIIRFASREEASNVVKALHQTPIPDANGQKFLLSQTISVKFGVLTEINNMVKDQVTELQKQLCTSKGVNIIIFPPANPRSVFSTVKISGNDFGKVAAAQKIFKKLLEGDIAIFEGGAIWHPFFKTNEGLNFVNQAAAESKIYVVRDVRQCCLRMYGPQVQKDRVAIALQQKVEDLSNATHVFKLTPELLKRALAGGLQALAMQFGAENAKLDVRTKTITLHGSQADFDMAIDLLSDPSLVESSSPRSSDECCICSTEAAPFMTPCKHFYCKECIEHQCFTAGDNVIPTHCWGADDCTFVFPLPILQAAVSSAAFEALLESSFTSYVKTHPNDLQYCPTPDCTQVYRKSSPEKAIPLDCPTCLASICTACQNNSHGGISCAEFQAMSQDGTAAFEEYKKSAGIKSCPGCQTSIQKSEGCNHMTCLGCKIHICWRCMATFPAGKDCYAHMTKEHGGAFDYDIFQF